MLGPECLMRYVEARSDLHCYLARRIFINVELGKALELFDGAQYACARNTQSLPIGDSMFRF